ncbi:MAG: hypothetical protein KME06_11235 [Kastovskya adunca ATA6-11-RM4]|nr:hypothetical protein [Kastovskya adunca ATA6-11-RM4]
MSSLTLRPSGQPRLLQELITKLSPLPSQKPEGKMEQNSCKPNTCNKNPEAIRNIYQVYYLERRLFL